MDKEQVLKHTLELLDYIEKENYLGYDPYDFYLSPYAKYIPKSILFLHLQNLCFYKAPHPTPVSFYQQEEDLFSIPWPLHNPPMQMNISALSRKAFYIHQCIYHADFRFLPPVLSDPLNDPRQIPEVFLPV